MDGIERYTLTPEGRARFRRMEARADVDTSVDTEDYRLLLYLYRHGPATIPEIEGATNHPWAETVARLTSLINRGLIEGSAASPPG